MNYKVMTILLILLCCFMGAVSAADDVSADFSGTIDDAITVDAVSEDISDSATVEETQVSDETTTEETSDGIKNDEISEESAIVDSEPTRSTYATVSTWSALNDYCKKTSPQTIHVNGAINATSQITIKNSATIIGDPGSYITGGSNGVTYFVNIGDLSITFKNMTFKNMHAGVLFRLTTINGTNKFINCSFENIYTSVYKSSVIWNDNGTMNISGCNFTNCQNGFGAVTNFATNGSVWMNVENCRFVNNTARSEPGGINNCGELNVTNSTFINNKANMWAGALHTHTNSTTHIENSTFNNNVAGSGTLGWNGGALFSYGTLEVINSVFNDNYCHVGTGGGAIFGYSYQGSTYNITVNHCNFTRNVNNYTNGNAGAIGVQNIGYLYVYNSIFVNNSADIGQAIAAISKDEPYCLNCTNCSCPHCPNCTNCTHHNVSTGNPTTEIVNNTFINHTGAGETVIIAGNHYLFENNTFPNSTQHNNYTRTGNPNDSSSLALINVPQTRTNNKLGSSKLSDENDEIYVDITGIDDYDEIWDLYCDAFNNVNNGGTVYLSKGVYSDADSSGNWKNFTVIGLDKENTIINILWGAYIDLGISGTHDHFIHTYKNITFSCPISQNNDLIFEDCVFVNSTIGANNYVNNEPIENTWDIENSYNYTYINCDFINTTIQICKFGQINFINCTFENITADSIVRNNGGFTLQDAINLYDCTFTNVNVKGIIDVPAGSTPVERYRIEGCTGVENFGPITEGDHDYVNITQSRAETVLVVDIDTYGNLLVNLTDASGNAMAEDEVLISVNGAEATPYTLGTDGLLSIALADLTDATGKLNIAVSFEENDDYKGSTGSVSTVLVINNVTVEVPVYITVNQTATSITASDLTATAKVAKTLTVTLKDANGNVLANKAVKVTVNGKASTVTTDKNGVAKVNVNYAKAGTYYYTLSFLGDNDYKASMKAVKVTVNKQATKATFAKKTFKVKAKTKKITFTLKDAKGKAIKGKKITFTVNKKTYTAKTNAKGIATVKVKLTKKGKYTAVAKFAGDNTYKAISKKAKITVK